MKEEDREREGGGGGEEGAGGREGRPRMEWDFEVITIDESSYHKL